MTPDTMQHARALAALGHEARLAIFRLLVRAGPDGLRVGEIRDRLDIAPSTLAHHLSTLVDAGLVRQEKRGREVFSMADYRTMNTLVGFLTAECCVGFAGAQDGGTADCSGQPGRQETAA